MRHTFGKTLGGLLAALCLVSTFAMAGEMTCTASDGKGHCTGATGPDGSTLVGAGGTRCRGTVAAGVTEAAKAGGSREIDGVRVRATAQVFLAARAARLAVATTGGRLQPRRSTRRGAVRPGYCKRGAYRPPG